MRKRLEQLIRCPACGGSLKLEPFEKYRLEIADHYIALAKESGVLHDDFNEYIESGLLLCKTCMIWHPIMNGVPMLLTFTTTAHESFRQAHKERLSGLSGAYSSPSAQPATGEQFVMESFSKEWLEYEYDGILWSMDYDECEKRFLSEVGLTYDHNQKIGCFLEIGCGLGITTCIAHKTLRTDSIGVDLSQAVHRAARHYKGNPFLHFIQASVFHLPLRTEVSDLVYSHGVLHHTYSTHDALRRITAFCKRGGLFYLWVYGKGSIQDSLLRRAVFPAELTLRSLLSTRSSSWVSQVLIRLIACFYMAVGRLRPLTKQPMRKYTYKRAIHAARDRCTPLFAHRHEYEEISKTLENSGFESICKVDWQSMPLADQENYRRNIGIRGRRQRTEPISPLRS